ncbi:MAG TPA: AAA family ATPase [Legionellales bacterium]|nr:AAA family ATPase [Legionellales bacterium]HCA89417.1 AAA family ATPase [Legionellales bacterium]|tara:strand:+ start:1102 stop:2085 length:984 start_codon:yes stop_codon:yes gene_type:complete
MEQTSPNSVAYAQIQTLKQTLNQAILGQPDLINKLLIALLADGHLLVEGAPGLAKTRAIKELAQYIQGDFHRIQFTPDLLPSDLTGTDIFHPQTSSFEFQKGPLFHHLVLADEINRAPAKVQAALLEAMAERQITIGKQTYKLPDLFLVMATQNPLEHEGTYALPEAQLDRFLLYVKIDYPSAQVEQQILQLARSEASVHYRAPQANEVSQSTIFTAREEVLRVHLSANLETYLVQLVMATRMPAMYDQKLAQWIRYGVSPRATIALDRCARAHAWLENRDYVMPCDIHAVLKDVLRHRLLLSFEAEAEGISVDEVITHLTQLVAVP